MNKIQVGNDIFEITPAFYAGMVCARLGYSITTNGGSTDLERNEFDNGYNVQVAMIGIGKPFELSEQ